MSNREKQVISPDDVGKIEDLLPDMLIGPVACPSCGRTTCKNVGGESTCLDSM